MDAVINYTNISGSATRNPTKIDFTAYGQGVVKLIWNGIELYKFNISIEGNCDFNGNGKLTKF